jgi:hypothetical protein
VDIAEAPGHLSPPGRSGQQEQDHAQMGRLFGCLGDAAPTRTVTPRTFVPLTPAQRRPPARSRDRTVSGRRSRGLPDHGPACRRHRLPACPRSTSDAQRARDDSPGHCRASDSDRVAVVRRNGRDAALSARRSTAKMIVGGSGVTVAPAA